MRTIIDIPKQDIDKLDDIKQAEGVSRNELVKRGINLLLESYNPVEVDAFGLWQDNNTAKSDGLEYQQQLRDEW